MEFQFGNVDHVFVLPTGQVACRKESLKGIVPHGIIVTPDSRKEDLQVDDDSDTYNTGWDGFTGRPATAVEMDLVIRMEYNEFGPQYHNDILGRRFWKFYETGLSESANLENKINTFLYKDGTVGYADLKNNDDLSDILEKLAAKIKVPREDVVLPIRVLELLSKIGYDRFLTHGSSIEFYKTETDESLIARFELQVLGDEKAHVSILRNSILYQTDTDTYVKYYDSYNNVFGAVESFINDVLVINQTYVFPVVLPVIK